MSTPFFLRPVRPRVEPGACPPAGEGPLLRARCALGAAVSGSLVLVLVLVTSRCAGSSFISVETPVPAALDVSSFSRVLVAGFIAGGSGEIDANDETTRVLKSVLRSGSGLTIVGASEALPLLEMATHSRRDGATRGVVPAGVRSTFASRTPKPPRSEAELKTYEPILRDAAFWRRIGEEYGQPIIITGTVLFTAEAQNSLIAREREVFDGIGRRRLQSRPAFAERTVHSLIATFVFIDGRTGSILHSRGFREQTASNGTQREPALSAYFQLMDRVVPELAGTLTNHTVRGARALLK